MKRKFLLTGIAALCALAIFVGAGVTLGVLADTGYVFGNATTHSARIEAEDESVTFEGSKPGNYSPYQTVNGTAVAQGATKSCNSSTTIHVPVTVDEAGTYVLKIAYYIGCNSNKTDYQTLETYFKITPNGGEEITGHKLVWNGFDNDYKGYGKNNNRRMCFYDTIEGIVLQAGANDVAVKSTIPSPYSVHYDFFEFYKTGDVYYYPIEKNLGMVDGLCINVGDRIEMEWGVPTDYHATKYSNSILNTSYRSGGYGVGLGTSAAGAATLNYLVTAQEEGDYYVQVVMGAAANSVVKHKWTVSQGEWSQDYAFTFDGASGEATFSGANAIPTAWRRELHLKKGVNNIAITLAENCSGHETDHFTIFPKSTQTEKIYQVEEFALGNTRLTYSNETYAVIEGYGAEMKWATGFEHTELSIPVTVTEAGYYDLFLRIFSNWDASSFRWGVDVTEESDYTVQAVAKRAGLSQIGSDPTKASLGDNVVRVYLTEGEHVLSLRTAKENKPYTVDWFCLTKAKVQSEHLEIDRGESLAFAYEATSLDPTVVAYENGMLVAKKPGKTTVSYANTLPNGYVYQAKETVYVMGSYGVDERIEAESCMGEGQAMVAASKASGGSKVNLGTGYLTAKITVPTEGDYLVQIALNADANACVKQTWTVGQGEGAQTYDYTFDGAGGDVAFAGAGNVTSSAWRKALHLKAGENVLTVQAADGSAAHTLDYFTVLDASCPLGKVREFENYTLANVNTAFTTANYAVVSGHGAELNHNTGYETARLSIPVTVEEAGYYDFFLRIYSNHSTAQFKLGINAKTDADYVATDIAKRAGLSQMGQDLTKAPNGDNIYRIYLPAGENEITIRTIGKVYTFDWFYLAKATVLQDRFVIDAQSQMPVPDGLSVDDGTVATVADGTLTGVKGGTTYVNQTFAFDNGYTYVKKYLLTVNKIAYTGSELVAEDETVPFDGKAHRYNDCGTLVQAPAGWSIAYNGEKTLVTPETSEVYVRFTHDVYKDVVRLVTFAVVPAVYDGDELIASDVTGYYNGTRYAVTASAPSEWEIFYSTNGRTVPGQTTVTVTFTREGYVPVVKTATITVRYAAEVVSAAVTEGETVSVKLTIRLSDEVMTDTTAKLVLKIGSSTKEVALSDLVKEGEAYTYTYTGTVGSYDPSLTASVVTAVGRSKALTVLLTQ